MNLDELEGYFASVATSTSGPPADIADVFKGSPGLSASARLGIYNRGYHYRLLDALASVFEHTKRALGAAEFERLGFLYLARYPSQHPAVERVGRHFPEYLNELSTLPCELCDLAALEWARLSALVAPDPNQLALAQHVNPAHFPGARLLFVPSLTTLALSSRALWLFASKSVATEQTETTTDNDAQGVAVWRQRYTVHHEALDALEFEALRLARAGASVSRLCALLDSGNEADDVQRAFRMISAWFAREWIECSK